MLQLAVATNAETYERMQSPLRERGIDPQHVETAERSVRLAAGDRAYRPAERTGSFDVGFVFPPRLAEGGVANGLLDIPWVNGREEILRSRFKGETLAHLSTAGVPVPESVVVSDPTDESALRDAFEQFDPPVVIKPNSTTRGVGVAKAHDLDSFLGICDYLDLVHDYRATGDQSFLVQEYLPGARDYRVMLIDGEVVGAVERRLPEEALESGQWKHNVHRGAEATGVSLDPALRALAERAAEALDIPWLGVDLLVTDDRAVVNETNARPTIDTATKYEDGFWDDVAALIESHA
ncbi:ATP-grasp domain-containing protein [Halovenus sp. WSH3]|uniref:ATP-grasp domain-containing protein n=1 Tax=Halovenus carboxidivorans TaxID=2692199 RepID=A0A6B0TG36_9EURY|nr:ATP-grasp domain-containing protein [Halovenus carboxidivorans]MXR52149.1 ATP-grasp domain-containing protein [Halovenus carboxidivorans]